MLSDEELSKKLRNFAETKHYARLVYEKPDPLMITIDGHTASIDDWAEAAGLTYSTLYGRVKSGQTGRELLRAVEGPRKIKAHGKSMTITEWAKHSGIPRGTIVTRLRDGIDPETAVTTQPEKREFHGMSGTSIFHRWQSMILRCTDPENDAYPWYGGRGIKVCDRWRESFLAYWEDVGDPPDAGYSVDRIDNDGDYEPGNTRWATTKQQARNRRKTKLVTINGETKPLSDWVEQSGVEYHTAQYRLKVGWDPERAVFEMPDRPSTRKKQKPPKHDKINPLTLIPVPITLKA